MRCSIPVLAKLKLAQYTISVRTFADSIIAVHSFEAMFQCVVEHPESVISFSVKLSQTYTWRAEIIEIHWDLDVDVTFEILLWYLVDHRRYVVTDANSILLKIFSTDHSCRPHSLVFFSLGQIPQKTIHIIGKCLGLQYGNGKLSKSQVEITRAKLGKLNCDRGPHIRVVSLAAILTVKDLHQSKLDSS